jgi:hypothetical protein
VNDSTSDRFRRLERARPSAPDETSAPSGTGTRIEAVRGPDPEPPPRPGAPVDPVPGGSLDRFRPAAERDLELDLADHDDQPFLRCAGCETDNFRTAARCTTCGADLDTEAQRAFNQRFWAGRRAEAAAEEEASAARRAALEEEQARDAVLRRQAAESMARQVGEAERRRLEREGFSPGWAGGASPVDWTDGTSAAPLGVRLLRRLPPGWPIPVGLALVLLPVLLSLVFMPAGLVAGAVVLVLFTPPRWRSRLGARWD